MLVRIEPGKLHGKVSAPPSKSYAQRLIIGAALSDGESVIKGISNSEDMGAALDCISALGAGYELSGDTVRISGRGVLSGESSRDLKSAISNRADGKEAGSAYWRTLKEEEENDNVVIFPCRESGNTLRFFIPISLCFFDRVRFSGSKRLIERGISVYEEIFEKKGLSFDIRETSIDIKGKLEGGEYRVRGDVSSQFITGLLFALPLLDKDSIIELIPPVESRAYIDITIDVLKSFGIAISEPSRNRFYIKGGQRYKAQEVSVEGDWSNAAFLFAFNALGHELLIEGLNNESIQGDRACVELFKRLDEPEPVIDISGCPDLGPVLFAVSGAKHGASFTGTRRLRIKESDRISAMAEELEKLGITMEASENRVRVYAGALKRPSGKLYSHNDHRIVMALSVLLSLTGGEIEEVQAVRKTWPDFFDTMKTLSMDLSF